MSRFSCSDLWLVGNESRDSWMAKNEGEDDGLAGEVVRAGELRFAFSARGKRSKENEKKRMIKIKKNAE